MITENLLVGNINDLRDPPVKVGALLLVAAEFTLEAPVWLVSGVSSIDQRNTLSYLLEMECDDETSNPHLLECCTTSGYLGSLAAWRIPEFNWPPL
jgi:hypothetical protein